MTAHRLEHEAEPRHISSPSPPGSGRRPRRSPSARNRLALASALGAAACAAGFPAVARAGNGEVGRQKAQLCVVCHGPVGISQTPDAPHLAGQPALYVVAELKAYRSGKRVHPAMNVAAKPLSDADIEDLAAWYASIKVRAEAPGAASKPSGKKGAEAPGAASKPGDKKAEAPGGAGKPGDKKAEAPGPAGKPGGKKAEAPGPAGKPGGKKAEAPGAAGKPGGKKAEASGAASKRYGRPEMLSALEGRR